MRAGGPSGIRLVVLDVDGVLTDGRILLDERGGELKTFHVRDGLGIKKLQAAGIEVAIVSGRSSLAVEHRARELGIEVVHQGVSDKRGLCRELRLQRGLDRAAVCCVGDDLPDLEAFAEAGLRVAVADAVRAVRAAADRVTRHRGGEGAVRELCEWLLTDRDDPPDPENSL